MRKLLFLLVAVALFIAPAIAQSFPLHDDGVKDPSFQKFRQSLQKIVKNRDWKALSEALDPKIVYSYGIDKPGREGFLAFWKQPGRDLWSELGLILERGGRFDDKRQHFLAPYTYSCDWPKGKGEDCATLVGQQVPIYEKPDKSSRSFKPLSYYMVRIHQSQDPYKSDPKWTKIYLPSDYQNALKIEAGYVETKFVAQPTDYHADFQYKNGRWMLSEFTGGC